MEMQSLSKEEMFAKHGRSPATRALVQFYELSQTLIPPEHGWMLVILPKGAGSKVETASNMSNESIAAVVRFMSEAHGMVPAAKKDGGT